MRVRSFFTRHPTEHARLRLRRSVPVAGFVGLMAGVLAVASAPSAFGVARANAMTEPQWQRAVAAAPDLPAGCYEASYPSLQWHATTCGVAPKVPLAPAAAAVRAAKVKAHTSGGPNLIGNGVDDVAQVTGTIKSVTGTFKGVKPTTTEHGRWATTTPNTTPTKTHTNTYTLQLNTEFFHTSPACATATDPATCLGWEQFVYSSYTTPLTPTESNSIFIQYWLINYGSSPCPSVAWTHYGTDCYTNSTHSANLTHGQITAPDLATTVFTGTAATGGTDSVGISYGGHAYLAKTPDTKIGLAAHWTQAEFNVFGDAGGAEAKFGPTTKIEPELAITGTSTAVPSCITAGYTGETNNLTFTTTPSLGTKPSPTIGFDETNTLPAGTPNCSTAAGTGTTPKKLAITTEPTSTTVNTTFTVGVSVENTSGTVLTTDSTTTVALKISAGTTTATLTCTGGTTDKKKATSGVAAFACHIGTAHTGYEIQAKSTGLTSATTTAFTITGTTTPSKLVITKEPTSTSVNTTFTVGVSVENAGGVVLATDSTTTVALKVSAGTTGATLTCTGASTDKKTVTKGVAAFKCHIGTAHTGYVLQATSTGLTAATTTPFTISATTTPKKLAVAVGPTTTTANTTFTVGINVENKTGTVLTTDSITTVALKLSPTATLTCTGATTDKKKATGGLAAFTCHIGTAHTGYKIQAKATGLTSITTAAFTITVTPTATKLAVTTEPSSTTVNTTFSLKVSIENKTGTVLTTKTTSVTLAIKSGTGATGAVLTCGTNPKTAALGVATFTCKINKVGGDYKLTATSGGLTAATTRDFTITTPNTGGGGGTTTVPSAPGGVKATAGTSEVTLTWQPVTGASAYAVYDAKTKGGENTGGSSACTVTAPGHTCTVKGLTDGTTYYFVVVTREGSKSSNPSTEVHATPVSAFPAPAHVTATIPSSTTINVVWGAVTGATGYDVYLSTKPGGENLTGAPACKVTAPADSCTLSGLSPSTTYYIEVVALSGTVRSAASTELKVTTLTKAATPTGAYRFVARDGGIFDFGGAAFYGSEGTHHLNAPIVGMASTPTGGGYWLVASDGGIFTFGNARFMGSEGTHHLNQPIVGMASTPTGGGYWLVASDGGIFTFGNAKFMGSEGTHHLNAPIVGMASTPTGGGYWLVASDGGIFTFGNARFMGSEGTHHLNQPIVGMASTPTGGGYWLVASDGGIFTFGNAKFMGSEGTHHLNQPIVGMASTPTGGGYWLVASDGGIFTFGNAVFAGSDGGTHLNEPIVGMTT